MKTTLLSLLPWLAATALFILIMAPFLHAETNVTTTPPPDPPSMIFTHIGVIAHAAGTAADAYSNWKFQEANPLLRERSGPYAGTFHKRGVLVKAGLFTGIAVTTELIAWKVPKLRRAMGIINGTLGATYTGIAIRNVVAQRQAGVR